VTAAWTKLRVKFVAGKIGSGKTPAGGADAYVPSGVMLLRSQNVHFDGLRLEDVVFIDEDTDAEMASTRVQEQDVLLNITGASLGRCAVVPPGMAPANVNQHVCIVRPRRERIDPRFLQMILQSPSVQSAIFASENGSSREGLTFEQVGNFELSLPSRREQQAIVTFLDAEIERIDRLRGAKERVLDLLGARRRALIARAVTRGLDPQVELRDSRVPWLGAIPTHWKTRRLAWLFRERDERGAPELPLLEVSISAGVILREFSDERIEATAADFNTYKVARAGDVVFNKMRMWQGAVGVAPEDGLVSPDYVVAAPTGGLLSDYAGLLFRTEAFSAECARRSHGIVWDRLRLYWEGFREIEVPLPTVDDQASLVAYVAAKTKQLDGVRAATTRTIALLKERRAALIDAAVSGRIDAQTGGQQRDNVGVA